MGLAFSVLYLGRPVRQGRGLALNAPPSWLEASLFFPADPFGVHHEPPFQLLAGGGVGLREPLELILDCRLFDLGSAAFTGSRLREAGLDLQGSV